MKKTICWITSGYLLQVDLPVIKELTKEFNIQWIVFAKQNNSQCKTAMEYAKDYNIELKIISNKWHRYSPMTYLEYNKIIKHLSNLNADIYYFNIITFPYLLWSIKRHIPSNKVVMAMHHGHAPTLMDFRPLYILFLKYLCKQPYIFQYFSETQASYFTGNINNRYIINLSLNNYGKSSCQPPKDYVSFLFFGNIIGTKNVEGIIKAAQSIKGKTSQNFKIKICGYCRNWNYYQSLIKYPELFELQIKRLPDDIIPNLFSSSHYLLLPYTFVSQSGPLRIAYGYNLPVIVSDLEGFKESVIEGITGRFCHVNDIESLAKIMQEVIENHPNAYNELKKQQAAYIESHMSQKVIISKYINMFNQIGLN